MPSITYQQAVVTGANRGLGLEFIRQLTKCSERIIATCREPEAAAELQQLADASPNVEVLRLDVAEQGQIDSLGSYLKGQTIDLLINNAGVGDWSHPPLDVANWERVLRINSIAPIKLSEALLESVAGSSRKLIANITSKMGSIADNDSGGAILYRSSKAALNAAVRSFALDHADKKIVNLLLHPGWVRTDMGGPNGLIDAPESVAGMLALLGKANATFNGRFFDYSGTEVPW